jgi:hypothetical protein
LRAAFLPAVEIVEPPQLKLQRNSLFQDFHPSMPLSLLNKKFWRAIFLRGASTTAKPLSRPLPP